MELKEKWLVSTLTLIGSLSSYLYGKAHNEDVVPYVMVGGYIGAWTGELITQVIDTWKNKKEE